MEYPRSRPLTSWGNVAAYKAQHHQSPRFECPNCHQLFSLEYGKFFESNDPRLRPEEAEPHFVCNDCVKLRRPAIKNWLSLTKQEIGLLALRCMTDSKGELRRLTPWTLDSIRDWGPEYFITELYNIDLVFLETPKGEAFLNELGTRLTATIFTRRSKWTK